MAWPDEIADGLPAPRDDEPQSLRDDIVDELSDHLRCSFQRELHFTPDQFEAERKVRDRFGDPRWIARQLWYEGIGGRLCHNASLW